MQKAINQKRLDFQAKLRNEFLESQFKQKRKNSQNLNYYSAKETMEALPLFLKTHEVEKMIKGHEILLEAANSTMLLENDYLSLACHILKDIAFYDCYPLVFDLLYGLSLDLQCFNQDIDLIYNIVDESFNIMNDDLFKQSENIYKILELFLSLITNNNQCCEYIISNNIIEHLHRIQLNWPNMLELQKLILQHILLIFQRNIYLINELQIIIDNYMIQKYNQADLYLLLFIVYKSKEAQFSETFYKYIFDFTEIPKHILAHKLRLIQELLFYDDEQCFMKQTQSQAEKLLKFTDLKLRKMGYKILSSINYKLTLQQQQRIVSGFKDQCEVEQEIIIQLLNKDFMTQDEIQSVFEQCINSDSEFLILKGLDLLDYEQLLSNKDLISSLDFNYIRNNQLIEKLEIIYQYY